jgi:hypothetical protein
VNHRKIGVEELSMNEFTEDAGKGSDARLKLRSLGLSSLKPSSEKKIHRSGSSGNSSCRRRPDSPPIPSNSLHRRGERHSP